MVPNHCDNSNDGVATPAAGTRLVNGLDAKLVMDAARHVKFVDVVMSFGRKKKPYTIANFLNHHSLQTRLLHVIRQSFRFISLVGFIHSGKCGNFCN
jgi:hypothetical protein